jgi:membrane protein implicated in regulation of membrane protease activity
MNKSDAGFGWGLAALMALCCGAKLLLLGFGLPALALVTGHAVVIAVAVVVAVAAVGVFLWRRRSAGRGTGACVPDGRADPEDADLSATPTKREPGGGVRMRVKDAYPLAG